MGFQSYERLAGDGEYRKQQQALFIAGEIRNPKLDYPHLVETELGQSILNLEPVFDASSTYDDKTLGAVVWDSASYRMAEMYWLLEAKRLNELAEHPESDEFKLSAARYQDANEQLYGSPDPQVIEAVYGEVTAVANSKNLHPSVQAIYDELTNGTSVTIGEQAVELPGIGTGYETRLPQDHKGLLSDLGDILKEEFDSMYDIVEAYWQEVISVRDESERKFTVDDMQAVFQQVHDFYDPENESGISVVIDPNSSQLAWDTPSMSVKIGGKRRAIEDTNKMVSKVIHEYGVHGLRAVNGRKFDIPAFDTGMYSDAEEGERSDYLTFEEGFASLAEMAVAGDDFKWTHVHLGHYIALASAYGGNDFRQTFERNWRMRAVMEAKDGQPLDEKKLTLLKKSSYLSCVRIFRGTPTELVHGPVTTFNKDLAYLHGKLDGLRYLQENKDNLRTAVMRLFLGKFDPNNRVQNELVKKYVES